MSAYSTCSKSSFHKSTVSARSLLFTFFTLLILVDTLVEARPKATPIEGLNKLDQLQTLPNGESPTLRRILYPTYSRDPFEMEKWEFYRGNGNKAFLINPMSRYSDLFDRNLRSPVDYVVVEQEDGSIPSIQSIQSMQRFESEEAPEFVLEKPGFLPFYSGRIGRR